MFQHLDIQQKGAKNILAMTWHYCKCTFIGHKIAIIEATARRQSVNAKRSLFAIFAAKLLQLK